MSYKLSAIALGIGVMFSVGAAHADTATISQTGSWNDSSIEQYDNNGATATITVNGYSNDAVVVQQDVNNANATITQTASAGDATIDQSGSQQWFWTVPGNNQYANIQQTWGWGNTAWVTQRGNNTDVGISQGGFDNLAGIKQQGQGGWVVAQINQTGHMNDGYIEQKGSGLNATINQNGYRNEGVILQRNSGHTATLTQVGSYNMGVIKQH